MKLRLLLAAVTIASASVITAQPKPAAQNLGPCTPTELTLAFARAMPYKTFLATDTTRAADWAAAEERTAVRLNGRPAVAVGVIRQATANPLDLSKGVREAIPKLSADLQAEVARLRALIPR